MVYFVWNIVNHQSGLPVLRTDRHVTVLFVSLCFYKTFYFEMVLAYLGPTNCRDAREKTVQKSSFAISAAWQLFPSDVSFARRNNYEARFYRKAQI